MKKAVALAERTNYVQGNQFTMERRYDDFKVVGKGSYGVVCSAFDEVEGKRVAIKKITPVVITCLFTDCSLTRSLIYLLCLYFSYFVVDLLHH